MKRSTHCQVCKEILFGGPSDPMDQYLAGLGGWGGEPLAVCLGSWRNLWRRKWYHQTCCGVYTDRTNRAGSWSIYGGSLFFEFVRKVESLGGNDEEVARSATALREILAPNRPRTPLS